MSDSSSDSEVETTIFALPPDAPAKKARKPLSDAAKAARSANLAKARAVRSATILSRLREDEEKSRLLDEVIADKKKLKERLLSAKAEPEPEKKPKKPKKKVETPPESESDSSEESDSEDEDEETYYLKPGKKKTSKAAAPVKPKRAAILEQMEQMAAELAALKKEKKAKKEKAPPVTVNLFQGTKAASALDAKAAWSQFD